jgi:sugar phosphate isomerase/epimerase
MIQIGTYVHGGGNYEEKIIAIKNAGFDFVAIGMGALSDGTLEYQVELCKKYGLEIDNIHLTGGKTTEIWFEDELGDKVCARYCREIKMAAEAGIKKGIAHITWGHKDPGEVSKCGIDRLTRMADCAQENGFLLCLENSVFIEHLYATMEKLKDHPAVRFTYDSGHRNAFAHDFDLLGDFGDKLAALHIDDNDAAHDLHLMPFDGNIDWERDARDLAKTEFARQRICAETSLGAEKKISDMSDEEISAMVDSLPIAKNPELFIIEGGIMKSYTALSYSDYMVRLHARLKRLADMIEANI